MSAARSPPASGRDTAVPEPGEVTEVAPGLLWVRLPLPFALDHINVWLLADGPGWTLVDTGVSSDTTRAAWERLLREVLGGKPLTRVLCTHAHPDHMGLAGWLAARDGAELWCTQAEWLHAQFFTRLDDGEARAAAKAFWERAGVPAAELPALLGQANAYRRLVSDVPGSHRRLRDGAELDVGGVTWRVVVGHGHSPEHACLHAPALGILIGGDQVLPVITPNVSVWPSEPDADPVGDFLATLTRLRALPDDLLVLPSHRRLYRGLHRRLDELAAHHAARLDEVRSACAGPRTAYEVMRAMFPRALDPHQTTFAIGEGLAHLNRLVEAGRVRRERRAGEPDRFVRAAAQPGSRSA